MYFNKFINHSLKQAYKMFNDFISNEYNNEEIVLPFGDDLIMQLSNSENEKTNLNFNF